jgi:beta-galactosidase GanA
VIQKPNDPRDQYAGRPDGHAAGITRRTLLSGTALAAAGLLVAPFTARASTYRAGPAGRTAVDVAAAAATTHQITFDAHSLMVDGNRLFVWSGEFHPFRLPSPSLWLDILQKMKSNGYNAVCMYFNWSYHSPASGVYDFAGVRDMDLAMRMAADTGIYVLARPGPYINGEVNAGGFPGWLTRTAAKARTNDPVYLSAADQWLTAINGILVKHQLTDGGGTLLLYQIENEYASNVASSTGIDYMAHLYTKARSDGIAVPIYHNDKGRNGDWIPGSFSTPDNNYLYAFDGYPSATGTPPDWGYYGPGGATGGASASPDTPGFEAEFGGGFFDPWGGVGYPHERAVDGPAYERQFYLTNVANGIKIQNTYMTFGGTSWGWLPASVVYTSYDYGAAISESRQLTDKVPAMKEIGYFLQAVPDICDLNPATAVTPSNSMIKTYHLTNPNTGTHFYFVRNDHTTNQTTTFPLSTTDGNYTVPFAGLLQLDGREMKVVVADYAMDATHLVYSTSHLMTHAPIGGQNIVLLAGRPGDDGETILRSRILVTPAGGPHVLVLVVDDAAAAACWQLTTGAGPVLVNGPAMVRTATVSAATLALTGDTAATTQLEVWAPSSVSQVSWNGTSVAVGTTSSGSLSTRTMLSGPPAVTLPALSGWKRSPENPETAPTFDDSGWTVANKTTTFSSTPIPAGQHAVLFTDDYGFHYGDVWYRGSWSGTSGASSVSLSYQSGQVGMLLAWLDGEFLGASEIPTPTSSQATTQGWDATATLAIPSGLRGTGTHVLAVLVRSMAHQEDGGANNAFKQALGLTAVTFVGASPSVTWRIQGALGGETPADPVRGTLNNGGLFGERNGWHLPGFADQSWTNVTLPFATSAPGVSWYRTTFALAVPAGVDASFGLTITDDKSKSYRAQLFLNGWNVGQYIDNVGPQTTFVLPNGLLVTNGANTLAIAVLADGTTAGGLGSVTLTTLGTVAGGVPVSTVLSPGHTTQQTA